jgi:hypothetical protein
VDAINAATLHQRAMEVPASTPVLVHIGGESYPVVGVNAQRVDSGPLALVLDVVTEAVEVNGPEPAMPTVPGQPEFRWSSCRRSARRMP